MWQLIVVILTLVFFAVPVFQCYPLHLVLGTIAL